MSKHPTKLDCPQCGTSVEWSDDFPHRPFCSKRCQLIDFGGWAKEEHRIAGDNVEDEIFSEDLDRLN
ncbi:DNA gyrase inhibitor YacG [Aurantivibrio plasticivorans]